MKKIVNLKLMGPLLLLFCIVSRANGTAPYPFVDDLSFVVQDGQIKGVVTDADGGALPGVNVLVVGTNKGTQTDFDGVYTISDVPAGASLSFSYVGYATQTVSVGGRSVIDLTLREDQNELDEVVVIGYGSVRKGDATGAVDAIGSDDFTTINAPSPAEVLRGKVAGVQVTSSSGEPGAGVSIRVRGNTSIRSGNEPLIVVDGVPLAGGNISSGLGDEILGSGSARNPLNFVNQEDIESINVLKDASSTAIYGSRGSNGVILITTKKGRGGRQSLSYSNNFSFGKFAETSGFEDVLTASEFSQALDAGSQADKGGDYYWQDVTLRETFSHNHNLSYSSSTEKSNTRLSLGVSDQQGLVNKTGLKKQTIAFDNTTKLFNDRLSLSSKVLYSRLEDLSHLNTNTAGFIGNIVGASLYWNPTRNVLGGENSEENSGYTFVSSNYLNPKHLLDAYDDQTITNKLLASVSPKIKITEGLTYKLLIGLETSNSNRGVQLLPTINIQDIAINDGKRGYAGVYTDNRLNTTVEHTLNYNVDINEDFNLDALLGYSYYRYDSDGNQTHAEGFNADQVNLIDNIEGAARVAGGFRATSYRNRVELQSYFARVSGTWKKLLASLTYRLDGSSKLGENNKTEGFYAVGLGYKIIDDKEGILNDLKARANYGITGNQEFDVNSAVAKASYDDTSIVTDSNSNKDLRWETTTSYGVGVDFDLIGQKLSGSVDYFSKTTNDLIFPIPQSATQPSPASSRFKNLDGDLIVTGFEVALNYNIINTEDMHFGVSGNASFLENTIENFSPFIQAGALHGQGLSGAYAQVVTEGSPIYSYYLFEFRGYDDQGISQYTQSNGAKGGLGTAVKKVLDKQALPKMNIGFSVNFSYKDFDFSTAFYGAYGHYIYNNVANALYFRGAFDARNVTGAVLSSGQSPSDPNTPSTKFLEKGDFLRWANLTIGYDIKSHIPGKIVDSFRIFVSGTNLATFTDYTGFDPEVDTDKTLNDVPSAGIDYLSYPRERTFSVGLSVKF